MTMAASMMAAARLAASLAHERSVESLEPPKKLWWAMQGSNLRPPCEGSALPLSYSPCLTVGMLYGPPGWWSGGIRTDGHRGGAVRTRTIPPFASEWGKPARGRAFWIAIDALASVALLWRRSQASLRSPSNRRPGNDVASDPCPTVQSAKRSQS
jgi:hypothetical protein